MGMFHFMKRIQQATTRISTIQRHFLSAKNMSDEAGKQGNTSNSPTVGVIIIGDEILKGHVKDTNSHFLCKRLFSLGVKVKKISVIPDDLETISNEVASFSSIFTHVITSGGIGPTHDDVTFEGIAKAFGVGLYPQPDIVALCKQHFGTDDLKNPKLKLAFVPETSQMRYGINKRTGLRHPFPIVQIRNVYIFPGIPKLLEMSFSMLENLFHNPDTAFLVKELYINLPESSITNVLNEADAKFKEHVILGSYPEFHNSYYKVKLTLESENKDKLAESFNFLQQNLPSGCIVEYDASPRENAVTNVYEFAKSVDTHPAEAKDVQLALSIIEKCLDKYSLDEICVGFNGGKDCTVLLHMVYAAVKKKYPEQKYKLRALYIRRGLPFPEVELFIKKTTEAYNLELITVEGRIRDSLKDLQASHPQIKAILMGTRRSDPFSSHLESFSPTDEGWPEYMRVNPILDWPYGHVWTLLRSLSLPYCLLYDRGYTSLGSMENTHPNPDLQEIDEKGVVKYMPAYQLKDSQSERAGRN